MAQFIYIIFFLSGAAALIFETIWFRLAGLVFGNSVWSAALVLGGFMGGLALGNGLVARYGFRIKRPISFYIYFELLIAITGMMMVMFFQTFENLLTPVFREFFQVPWLLNTLRCGIAFLIFLVPTTAMGATLPILVKLLFQGNTDFGLVLGRLYGWNTLGAVAGAFAGEIVLIQWLGIRGAGLTAAFFNITAAYVAVQIAKRFELRTVKSAENDVSRAGRLSLSGKRFLTAAFLSGGILLSLEVVWFRFLLLMYSGTTLIFAVMLSVVLMGIGTGGLLASWWCGLSAKVHDFLRTMAFLGGILTVVTYAGLYRVFNAVIDVMNPSTLSFAVLALFLMLPVSVISGILFTMLGRAIKEEALSETRAAGLLTLANTLGALSGSFLAGFVFLPYLGMERSFFLLAVGYGITAVTIPFTAGAGRRVIVSSYGGMAGFLLILVLFPFGHMKDAYFDIVTKNLKGEPKLVDVREGLTETNFYYRYDVMGEPFYYRLVTNGYSMSSTSIESRRYMKLFVYLPNALHPEIKHALLISYGVGSTAKALTDTKNIETIDIVDISKDILEMNTIVYPRQNEHPLYDKRVSVHIEDGRFFLLATDRTFDFITAEPPPPKQAGIVNLYSQEYFKLLYDRLSEGGMVSYWLPVHSLYEEEAKSIVKAFCNIFRDCSLWAGSGLDWMLIGTRNAVPPGSAVLFSRQWTDPGIREELLELGFETPEQIGALFIADASDLEVFTKDSFPLTDNFPLRLSTRLKFGDQHSPLYAVMMEEDEAGKRFQRSLFIRTMWPETLREKSLPYFSYQRIIKSILIPAYRQKEYNEWDDLYQVLTRTSLRTLPLWLLGTSHREMEIVNMHGAEERYRHDTELLLSFRDIAERNYEKSLVHLEAYLRSAPLQESLHVYPMYLFVLCMAGHNEQAETVAREIAPLLGTGEGMMKYREWMNTTFHLTIPL